MPCATALPPCLVAPVCAARQTLSSDQTTSSERARLIGTGSVSLLYYCPYKKQRGLPSAVFPRAWTLTGGSPRIARLKKVKSGNRRSAPNGRGAANNVDQHLTGAPQPSRGILNNIRPAIRNAKPREAT